MLKNLLLLGFLTWMSFSYASLEVAKETTAEAESYKIETGPEAPEVKRSVAGGKIKKKKFQQSDEKVTSDNEASETDSEVRYWQYSE